MIRPYGPGKFDTILDSYLYSLTLDGDGDVVSDNPFTIVVHTPGGVTPLPEDEEEYGPFTEEELEVLKTMVGFVLTENNQGFVDIEILGDQT